LNTRPGADDLQRLKTQLGFSSAPMAELASGRSGENIPMAMRRVTSIYISGYRRQKIASFKIGLQSAPFFFAST